MVQNSCSILAYTYLRKASQMQKKIESNEISQIRVSAVYKHFTEMGKGFQTIH